MSGILAYNNRFHVTASKAAEFSSADFDNSPPLSNLGKAQLPLFAQFDGASATLTCEATDGTSNSPNAESFDADVFAVLGCQDFDVGADVEFLNGMTSLGTATIEQAPLGGNHAILALDSSVNLDTLTVEFTNAGTGTHKVGAIWASLSQRFDPLVDVAIESADTGLVSRSLGNTAWAYGGSTYQSYPIRARSKTYLPWITALKAAQSTGPVLYQLDQRGLSDDLLKSYGLLDEGWGVNHIEGGIYDISARFVEVS